MKKVLFWALCLTLMLSAAALADSYTVSVGYADGLRGNGFFPGIWAGDAGVTFVGTVNGDDAGAIMITNTSGGSLTIDDVTVDVNGHTFDLWGSNTIGPGGMLILTQTSYYNFDTSDFPNEPCGVVGGAIPTVTVTANNTPTTFNDTGRVLNTNGYDFACQGNESFRWREIGGDGTPAGTPEPSTLALLGTGGLGLLGSLKKRFIN